MSVKLTKAYNFTTLLVSAEFVNLEAIKLFPKYVPLQKILTLFYRATDRGFRNDTEKGTDVSVRYTKNNSTVHFAAVPYIVDIIKLLLGKESPLI